ncbi:hypothetical protein [Crateriforma conspicua]|uniref:PilZ domain-containing protein n=1 Tax=Crateriforma conspicua TaxID=2527996 RepID=A0A5C5Y2Z9_9PLAN|nr:hypothetical protein [Crateriforma conspicua]QDV64178.1 hypothetical protein Mal65_33280 [Crateriforma conspicua]TWT69570.1 hypothetical protein Pan14r_18580 [Crateriforma conspicua]
MSQSDVQHCDSPEEATSDFFRCPVQADQGSALIRIGRRKLAVTVQETSIDGFTVLVTPEGAKHVKVGRPWVLEFDGTRFEVHAQWFFHSPDGHVQVGMRRLRDLTEPPSEHVSWSLFRNGDVRGTDSAGTSTLAFAGFILFLVTAMALPGLGDQLGTAKPMGEAARSFTDAVGDWFGRWL